MISFKSRLFLEDLEFFRSIVFAAAQVREPSVQLPDVWRNGAGKNSASGTAVFTFSCFAEDLETLRATAQSLFDQRSMTAVKSIKPYEPPAEYWPEGDPR